jgi:hypothetical protein
MRSAAIAAVLAAMFPTVDVGAVTLKPANGVVVTTGPAPQLTVVATNQLVDTADGAGLATGIVKNTGTGNVSNIEVDLAFYDSNNNVVESDDENTIVFADLDELAPGEQTGFTTIFALPAGYDHFGVTSVTGDDDPTPPNHNFTVAVTNTADDGLGGTSVTGTVKNNNAVTADDVDVTFIFLDAAGKPLFTDYAWPDTADGSLAAGASATFEEDAPS